MTYLVRIELHNGALVDYQNLHNQLSQNQFLNAIRGVDGVNYRLPRALYLIEYGGQISNVHDAVHQIVKSLNKTAEIFVVKFNLNDSMFSGLEAIRG